MSHDYIEFHRTLEDDDYGIVVNRNGNVKGIWVPRELATEEEIPATIARLCIEYFGIDPNDDSNYQTVH